MHGNEYSAHLELVREAGRHDTAPSYFEYMERRENARNGRALYVQDHAPETAPNRDR